MRPLVLNGWGYKAYMANEFFLAAMRRLLIAYYLAAGKTSD